MTRARARRAPRAVRRAPCAVRAALAAQRRAEQPRPMPSDLDMLLLNRFLLGALVMGCAVVGAFFLRFWRRTRDRLFLIFALAFWLLGINWLLLAFFQTDETRTWLYVLRLVAFCLIIYGIVDKNRQRPA